MRFPITERSAFDWLRGGDEAHVAFEVDGFVTTREGSVSAVFQKYELPRGSGPAGMDGVDWAAVLHDHRGEIGACAGFAERLQAHHRVFAWPMDFPRGGEEDAALVTSIAPRVVGGLLDLGRRRTIDLARLAAGIRKLRGRSFAFAKPLLSATSAVECYLANRTSDPWPGDVDAVLARWDTGAVVALVEFKTHNRDSPVEREHLGKYGRADWRRFRVLYQLQDRLAAVQGTRPRLYYVAWGTQDIPSHRRVKVDLLGRDEVLETVLLERPAWGERSGALLEVLAGA